MGNLPGWVIPVIILIIVVLAILIIVGVVSSRRRRARQEEIDRQRAAELRSQAQKDQVEVKEREIKARETELEADKAKVEAERRDQTAQQQRQDADRARADVDGRLRQADELDPDVDTKTSGAHREADAPLDETGAQDVDDVQPQVDDREAPSHGAGVAAGAAGAGVAGAGAAGAGAAASHEEPTDRTEQAPRTDGPAPRHDAALQERAEERPRDARTAEPAPHEAGAPREAGANPDMNSVDSRDEHTTRPDARVESAEQTAPRGETATQSTTRDPNAPQPGAHAAQPGAHAAEPAGPAQPGVTPRDQRVPDDAPRTAEPAEGHPAQGRHEDHARGAHRAPAEGGRAAAAGGAGAAAGAGVAAGANAHEPQAAQDQRTARPAGQTDGRHRDARPEDTGSAREDAPTADDGATHRAQPAQGGAAVPATDASSPDAGRHPGDAGRQPGDADGHVLSDEEIDARATASGPGTEQRTAAPTAGDDAARSGGDTTPRSGDAYEDPRGAATPVESPRVDQPNAEPSTAAPSTAEPYTAAREDDLRGTTGTGSAHDGRTPRTEGDREQGASRPADDSDPFSVSESHVRGARRSREGDLDDGIEDTERGL